MATIPSWPTLKQDFTSTKNISALQSLLNYRNNNTALTITGTYDTNTYNAVKSYQNNNGLTADGIAGSGTLLKLISGLNIQSGTNNNAARAAQYLLSKFETITINGNFDSASANVTKTFQSKMAITSDGVIGATSWQYLFGYYFYPSIGCDLAATINSTNLQTLKNNGYKYVGRYLPGSNYPLTTTEKAVITGGGLFIYSIWEKGSPTSVSYFTAARGTSDATAAITGAKAVSQPANTPIYFAVDYNASSSDISGAILNYLQAVKAVFVNQNYPYKLGLYGPGALLEYYKNTFTYTMLAGATSWNGSASYSQFCLKQYPTINIGSGAGALSIDPNDSNGAAGGWQ